MALYGIDCDQALAELEAYLDGELASEARGRLEEHLSGCLPCFERGEFRRRLRIIVRRKCGVRVEMPPGLAERVRSLIASSDPDSSI